MSKPDKGLKAKITENGANAAIERHTASMPALLHPEISVCTRSTDSCVDAILAVKSEIQEEQQS